MLIPLRSSVALAGALVMAAVVLGASRQVTPAQPPDFAVWLEGVRAEALQRGVSPATVERALTGLEPEPVVVARDRAQPEQVQSLDAYLKQRLTARTRNSARTNLASHRQLLAKVEQRYGVPAEMVVSVWGLESNFGAFTGTRPIIKALATLAFDPRRATLFRAELFHALTIIDQGHITLDELKGSWAGAMGQPQFMPSSYLKHAVDFDEDGRADIWNTEADVFGSIANYLNSVGWVKGERWGREVRISAAAMARIERQVPMRSTGCRAVREMTEPRPLKTWATVGVTLPNGRTLPTADMEASLVRGAKQHFLVYRNYHTIIDYNCSNSYAIAAGTLADALETGR